MMNWSVTNGSSAGVAGQEFAKGKQREFWYVRWDAKAYGCVTERVSHEVRYARNAESH
jgi:hypothetical protein